MNGYENNPQDELIDDDKIPFTAGELEHVIFATGGLAIGITANTVDTTQAGTFSASYVQQGSVVGTSDLLGAIADTSISEDIPTDDTSSNTDGSGNTTDATHTGTFARNVTAITDPVTGEWYRYENVVTTYDIVTTYAAVDDSGYDFHQWGTYGYTLIAYGFNGNAVYTLTEYRSDNFVNEQWSASDPGDIYVITGSQGYNVDSGGYIKVNDDGLAAPDSTVPWITTVDTVNPIIDGTNASAIRKGRSIVTYGGSGYGRMEYSDYSSAGTVDHNGDFSNTWSQWYYTLEETPAGGGTERFEEFEYQSLHEDPYDITNAVDVDTTTTVGGMTRTLVIDDTTSLTGSKTTAYDSQGVRTTYADGTWESVVTHTTTRELHDMHTHTGLRTYTLTDNSDPNATVNLTSTSKTNSTRNRDSVQAHGTTTTRLVDGTQTVAGKVNGNTDSKYNFTTNLTMTSDGTYDDGATVMSYLTTSKSNSSGSGSYKMTSTGTFGTAGTDITNMYDSMETGSSDWDYTAESKRTTTTDDGKGNSSNSGGTSESTNNGETSYTNTVNINEDVTDAGVTSTGTMTHTGSGSGSNSYDQTQFSITNGETDTPEFYSKTFNDSSSYSNGSSTWESTSNGNGTVTNGEVDYTETITQTSEGNFASGNSSTFSAYTEEDDGNRSESHDSSGTSKFDELGTFESSNTDITHTSPAGNSSSSKSNYSKKGGTAWSSNSGTTTVIFEDYSSEDSPGSGIYISWHDEFHSSNSEDSGSGTYSLSMDSQSETAPGGTITTSGTTSYESSGSGITKSDGTSTISDYSHSDNNGVSSTSDSTSTVTRESTTTYENKASGNSNELNGIVTSLDTSSSNSDTTSTVNTKTDRVQDSLDTNNDDKITSNSHSESHATNDTTTISHSQTTSSDQRFGDGTNATVNTSFGTSDSTSKFTSNTSGNSKRNVNGLNGVTSEVTKESSSDTTGDSKASSESTNTHSTFADGTWSSSSTSFGDSAVNSTSNSSSTNDSTKTDTSTDVTKTVTTHGHQATTNAKQTVTTDWFNHSINGSSGGTTESWNDETITGSGDVESNSHSTLRSEKDPENFKQVYNESNSNGSYTVKGSSQSDRFVDGKTSFSSTYNRTETGTSSRKEEITEKHKTVSHPQPGLTKTVNSDLTDTTNWTDISYTTNETVVTDDPEDGPHTSTKTSSHSESGKQTWTYTANAGSSLTGTVNLPDDDSHGTTFNNSSSSVTKENGNADYNQSDSVTAIRTEAETGLEDEVISQGSNSLNGKSTLTITEEGKGSITQNREIGDTNIRFKQESSHDARSVVITNIDDSYSYETDGNGGTKSTLNSNPDITGTSFSKTTEETNVRINKKGYRFTKTEQDIDESKSKFNATLSHTIDTDFDGTTTHSGGGTSNTKSESSNEHYYDSNTYERKPALLTTANGYYDQEVINDREDITKEESQGDAVLIFEEDGTETWSGTHTKEHDINREYIKTTHNIRSVSEGKTDRDSDGIQEAYKKHAGDITEEHTREANRGKTEYQLQADGTLDDGKDVLDSSVKAFEMEKHEKKGNTVSETWEEKSNPSSSETVAEKWTHRHISGGSDRGFIKWSTSTTSYSEYFDKSDVTETKSTYDYERNVDTDTEISSETKSFTSTKSSGKSQTKIVTPSGSGTLNTEKWADKFTTSESKYHHASDGTRTTQHKSKTAPYDETIYFKIETKNDWDWDYKRVTKLESEESHKSEPGSDTAKAKIDREWEMTIDYTGIWNREQNISSTGATDGSTMNVENKSHEEITIEGDATVTYTAEYDVSGLNDDENPPVVTPVGNPQPVSIWTWVEDWSASASSTGKAHIVKYSPTYEWDEDTQQEVEIWEDRTFTGSTSSSESRKFTASDENVQGTESFTPGPSSIDMEDADFLGSHMEAYPEIYNGGVPYENGSETVDFQHFVSEISFQEQIPQEYLSNEFVLFESLDPSWLDQLTIGINDAFQKYFPELTDFLLGFPLEWEATAAFTSDLFRQLDDGTMADRTFGLIDGFLDGINPFNHWVSIPDIGPVYGHVEDYAFSKTVGTFAGIGTSIAISMMGPGLVNCGTLAHKVMVGWETADAIGSIGGAVTNIYNNGGQVGVMDVLGIVGGVASIGSVKSLMNKCFVGDTLVVYGKEDIIVTSTADEQTAGPRDFVALIMGSGFLIGAGVGWYLATRKRPAAQDEKLRRQGKNAVLDVFGDADFLDHLWLEPGVKRPLPAMALRDGEGRATLKHDPSRPIESTVPSRPNEPLMPSVTHRKTDVAQRNQSPVSRRIGWLLMLLCLLGSGLCFWQLPSGEFSADSPTVLQAAPEPRTRLLTRKIQDIRPGMRVLADNPELAGQTVMPLEIQPENWRLVTLEMPKADGEILTVELLRPAEEFYLAANADEVSETTPLPSLADLVLLMEPTLEVPIRLCQSACALPGALSELASFKNRLENGEPLFRVDDQDLLGRTLHLNLPEMGAVGPATIKEVSPCPAVEEGMGRIVTGRFIHKAANVIDLKITGVEEPIGTTDTHPFWSEDRQTFVPAGELRIGEELRTLTGEKTFVLAKSPRGPPEDVFNIEVEGEHVYNIADSGVLVHNGCDDLAKRGEDLYVGTYNSVRGGNKSSGLNSTHTPHHAVQNAVSPTTHGKGITINMRKDLHELTRTFKKPVDGSIKSLRDHLAADIHDLRKILGNAGYDRSVVNRQLKELIRQNKELWSSLGLGGQ